MTSAAAAAAASPSKYNQLIKQLKRSITESTDILLELKEEADKNDLSGKDVISDIILALLR